MEENMKIVEFEAYCHTCKHEKVDDFEDPCNDCLNCPARQYSHKPINWEEKE